MKLRILSLVPTLCVLCSLAAAAWVRTPGAFTSGVTDPRYEVAIERGRNIVQPLVRRGSGVAVAVGVDGRLVWSAGFGRIALDGGEPVQPETPFRVHSLMKQVTAVLAMQSALRGEVDMDASVRNVVPSLPPHYAPVTLEQLLAHRGGVRHYREAAEARLTRHCATAAEALPLFIEDPLVATPGGEPSYSTWGFVLASAVLERAAGLPFDALLARRILDPAGMTSTFLEGSRADDPLVHYIVDDDGEIGVAPPADNSCKMGGGGFLASAEDLVRFHNSVLRGELVPLAAVRRMLGDRTALLAAGSGTGGHAVSLVDVESGVSVVILSNTGGVEQEIALERARGLLAAVFADENGGDVGEGDRSGS